MRGTDDTGTSVGDSGQSQMQFARDNIDGALYYWTTSGKSAIMRWDFSGQSTAQTAQSYLTPTNTDGKTCVGCHALAPDGSALVASAGGQGDGRLLLWDIKNNKALQPFPLSSGASSSRGTSTARSSSACTATPRTAPAARPGRST